MAQTLRKRKKSKRKKSKRKRRKSKRKKSKRKKSKRKKYNMSMLKRRISPEEITKRHEKLKEEIMTQKGIWKHVYLHGEKPARTIQGAARGMQTREKKWIHRLSTQRDLLAHQSIKLYLPNGKNNSNVKPYSSSMMWINKWLNNPGYILHIDRYK